MNMTPKDIKTIEEMMEELQRYRQEDKESRDMAMSGLYEDELLLSKKLNIYRYQVKDTFLDYATFLSSDEDVIDMAQEYVGRINEEKEDGEKDVQANTLDEAINVLESANIYIKPI